MSKLHAVCFHLNAGVAVVLLILGIMWLAWYPAPYFTINGGWAKLRILAGVAVVLGPLLTLIVFKPSKPHLKLDRGVIVTIQMAVLAYGGAMV